MKRIFTLGKTVAVIMLAALVVLTASGCAGKVNALELARGVWDGDRYHNTFAGFDIQLPEGWVASSDEDIAALMGQSAEMLENAEEYQEQAAKLQTIYDAMIQDQTTGNNVIVIYMNVGLMGAIGADTDDYLQSTVEDLGENTDMSYKYVETTDRMLGSTEYRCARMDAEVSGIAVQQYYLMCMRGSYIVTVIVSTFDGSTIEDMLPMFEPAK